MLPFLAPSLLPPVVDTLTTPWTAKVSATKPHPEYPRPQMRRRNWVNLNGPWDLTVERAEGQPEWTGKILVPFPIESRLSGVQRPVPDGATLVYRRTFARPKGDRIVLHFGAVDWATEVVVNGQSVGTHRGGFDPFEFDITSALKPGREQELVVRVTDPTDAAGHPRGKQVRRPEGIYYTPTSGIWQTVWLEPTPKSAITELAITPNPATGIVRITAALTPGTVGTLAVEATRGTSVFRAEGSTVNLPIENPAPWTPESPALYDLKVSLRDATGKVVDEVTSYFGFRDLKVGKGPDGKMRILLNGRPYFLIGPLDQGFWPDGLFTAPTDAAMKYDLKVTKRLGFNFVRKHVKVEPATWYEACDRLGLIVWQDMPSGDNRNPEEQAQFQQEFAALIRTHQNHPSIGGWVLFNEAWGQHDTERLTAWLKRTDPTRIADSVTGWTDKGVGELNDIHVYPGPASPNPEPHRAAFLGEFGGLGLPTPGHMWTETGWGYQSFKTSKELTDRFVGIFRDLHELVGSPGLSGAVYTQTTDVETELNGLLTYDRRVLKVDARRVRKVVRNLAKPAPTVESLVPTSEQVAQTWRYTFEAPPTGWEAPRFDDQAWPTGPGGFGTPETPGAVVGTRWATSDVWLRRSFTVASAAKGLRLRIHHDNACDVYLDGRLVSKLEGWTSGYTWVSIPDRLAAGDHTLAVHCHQDTGGQFIDVGLGKSNGSVR